MTPNFLYSPTFFSKKFVLPIIEIKSMNENGFSEFSLLKVRPGMTPRFFSQKMAAKLPLKKIPSTAANATTRSGNVALS
ncbi:hypothetical protein ALC60_05231 [Trachymyrmex zeteki]|uniref:Uncharacterized protein n=1 Tax=Mycetomoellerius zeteki TaxID=64791 RepID=A0A151X6N0_9HYME|nr:hypothetical protein ALC60_05231 [Trachymyrmex zeteki]